MTKQKFELGDTVRIRMDFPDDGVNWNTYQYRGRLAIIGGSYVDQFGLNGNKKRPSTYTLYFLNKQGNKIIDGSSWHNEYCLDPTHIYRIKGLKKLANQEISIGHSNCSQLIRKLILLSLNGESK